MIRIFLPPAERAIVQRLRRDAALTPAERDRVEMVFLSADGWSPPRIAAHLGYNAATVRRILLRFQGSGPPSLRRQRPGPPPMPPAARR